MNAVILTDTARFHVHDVDEVVNASFACPYCLSMPASAVFNLEEPGGSAVLCRCDECSVSWVVGVDVGQAMRLAIAPPHGLALEAA
jgi:formate dehydrogenase maturation protein FdhE